MSIAEKYSDTDVVAGNTYSYKVKAVGKDIESELSEATEAKTIAGVIINIIKPELKNDFEIVFKDMPEVLAITSAQPSLTFSVEAIPEVATYEWNINGIPSQAAKTAENGGTTFVLNKDSKGIRKDLVNVLNSLKDEEIKSLRCVSDKTIMVVARDGVYEFVYTNSIADLQLVNSWKGMDVYGTSGYSPAKKFFWLSQYRGNAYNYGGEIFSFQESSYAWIAEKYRGDNFYSGTLTGIVSQDAEGGEVTVKTVRPDLLSGTLTISEDNATVILKGDEQ